jgi:hypothetical protein
MSIHPTSSAVAVDDTETVLVADNTAPVGRNEDGRITYEFYNAGPDTVYMGGTGVTVGTGQPLPAFAARTISLRHKGALYGICDTGATADVRVLRVP